MGLETLQMSEREYSRWSAGKRGRSGPELRNAQIVDMRVWGGRRDAPGALWGSVTHPAGAAAYHRLTGALGPLFGMSLSLMLMLMLACTCL
jgi:hypothetical protein